MRRFRSLVAASAILSALLLLPALADSIAYTTIPDNSGFNTAAGLNTAGAPCSWKAGGHVTYTKTHPDGAPPNVYAYGFTQHNSTACGTTYCQDGLNAGYIKVSAVSGAGTDTGAPNINLWYDSRVFAGTTELFSLTDDMPWSITLYNNTDYWQNGWTPGGIPGSTETIQYKVGAWQGSQSSWTATAATPGL